MTKKEELANLIFPNIKKTVKDLEKKYPKRKLKPTQEVTRFAPSPTGYLHTGSLFTALISYLVAKKTKGVFFARLEDTDTKREIEDTRNTVFKELEKFNIIPSESHLNEGKYKPYIQSQRKEIYDTVIKEMIIKDLAYPCFMTQEELTLLRKNQESKKINPGYYQEYARDRFLDVNKAIDNIKNNKPFVIRFKSPGDLNKKIKVHDLIKKDLELPENVQDIVIQKQDGLPTYHFAHVVDDHFMHTTIITRGEEWLSSLPIHIQLFQSLNFTTPKYAHLPLIMKLDEGKKRKLSKRKDPEAAVSYFLEKGYPIEAFLAYLMTIVNSNFEKWYFESKDKNILNFDITFDKMQSADGALFDVEKLNFISKEFLGNLNKEEFYKKALAYSKVFNKDLYDFINKDADYFKEIINIERGGEKPRKDYSCFSEVLPLIGFMDEDIYNQSDFIKEFNPKFKKEDLLNILSNYLKNSGIDKNEEDWFSNLKEMALSMNFAKNNKQIKKEPNKYLGTIGDFAEVLRIAISGKKSIPNFYLIQKILTKKKVEKRLVFVINKIKSL